MNELRKLSTVLRAVRLTIWAGRKTRHDRLFLHRLYRCVVAILAVAAAVQVARADVPPAYPPQNTPAIQQMATARTGQGFHFQGQYITPDSIRSGQPVRVFNRATPSLGQRSHPVSLTNNYGAVATGTIQTQTAMPGPSKLAQGFGALYVMQMANQHLTNLKAQGVSEMYSRGFEEGDWAMVADATARLFDWTGFGANVRDSLYGNADVQQLNQQLQQQALAQAQQQFNQYQAVQQPQQIDPNYYAQYNVVTVSQNHPLNQDKRDYEIVVKTTNRSEFTAGWFNNNDHGQSFSSNIPNTKDYFDYTFPPGNQYVIFKGRPATAQDIRDYNLSNAPQLSEIVPKEADVARLMEQLLNDNNRNHTELMNALWNAGVLNPSNTQTMISGSPADNTFLTQPFTPAGSDQAQQTQFVVHNNGTVTQSTVNRPDLAANTSQAPTRAEVGQSQQQAQDTRPAKENSSAEKPDICAQNPNSLMCAEAGNADYTDPVIPEKQIDFDFKPANIFSNDGVCPQPVTFEIFGKSYQFSYAQSCDFLRKVRPLIILAAMVTAMIMAYNAVKEL